MIAIKNELISYEFLFVKKIIWQKKYLFVV